MHLVVDLVADVDADHERIVAIARRDVVETFDPHARRVSGHIPQTLQVGGVGPDPARLRDVVIENDHKPIEC